LLFSINAILKMERVVGLGKAFSISLLNQAVSSGTNFAMGLYLVRFLTPMEFGLYGIGFAISLYYSGIGISLFHTQMVVHVPDKASEDRLPYAARILAAITIFSFLMALVGLLIHFMGKTLFACAVRYECLVFPITAASISFLFKEFFIRHSYTAKKEIWALIINSAVAFSLGVLLLFQYYSETKFSTERALCYYAISNQLGAVAGFFLVRLPIGTVRRKKVEEDLREAWRGGRWAVGAGSIIWLQSQAYTYLTAGVLGPAGVGYANAAQMLIKPFLMLLPAINQMSMPVLAALNRHGRQKAVKVGFLITTGLLFSAMIYATMVIIFEDRIVTFVLGSQFSRLRPIILGWTFVLFLMLLRDGAENILQAMKNFRTLMLTYIVSAGVTIFSAIVLMKSFGVIGSILGMGVGEFILASLLWRIVLIERNKSS
jgi:O-antigen/teichoic acid export membrane protein